MGEITTLWTGVLQFLLVFVFGILYTLAGRDDTHWFYKKWIRRWLAPIILIATSYLMRNGLTVSIDMVCYGVALAFLIIGLSKGYGATGFWIKVQKRFICALIICGAYVTLGFVSGNWSLVVLNSIIAISSSVILGVFNPLPASKEEFLIAISYALLIPYI